MSKPGWVTRLEREQAHASKRKGRKAKSKRYYMRKVSESLVKRNAPKGPLS